MVKTLNNYIQKINLLIKKSKKNIYTEVSWANFLIERLLFVHAFDLFKRGVALSSIRTSSSRTLLLNLFSFWLGGVVSFNFNMLKKKKKIVLRINCNLIKVVLKYTQNNIQIIQNWKVFLCYRNLSSRDKATKFNLARKAKISKHFLATFIYIWKTLSDCYTS